MRRVVIGVAVIVMSGLCGCVQRPYSPSSIDTYIAQQRERERQEEAKVNDSAQRLVAGTLPKDYRERADKWLAGSLKDPDSRKVNWLEPRGAVACGTVNAKNSYGGYAGAAPFAVLFAPDGTLKNGQIYSDVRDIRYMGGDDRAMAAACGIR